MTTTTEAPAAATYQQIVDKAMESGGTRKAWVTRQQQVAGEKKSRFERWQTKTGEFLLQVFEDDTVVVYELGKPSTSDVLRTLFGDAEEAA